jgi:hypothetical protein
MAGVQSKRLRAGGDVDPGVLDVAGPSCAIFRPERAIDEGLEHGEDLIERDAGYAGDVEHAGLVMRRRQPLRLPPPRCRRT